MKGKFVKLQEMLMYLIYVSKEYILIVSKNHMRWSGYHGNEHNGTGDANQAHETTHGIDLKAMK